MRRRSQQSGFTLIEIVIAMAILFLLISLASMRYESFRARAKRTEAIYGLSKLWELQHVYVGKNGRYASTFQELGFRVTQGTLLGPTTLKGGRYTYQLSQPWGERSYHCSATGNIDTDPWPDVLIIEEGAPFAP